MREPRSWVIRIMSCGGVWEVVVVVVWVERCWWREVKIVVPMLSLS